MEKSKTQIPAVMKNSAMDYKYTDCKEDLPEPVPEEAEPERGNWTGRFDFLLSLLGYSVGLGNVWRFPYLCYNNGGGAFLIPFTVMLIIAGLPLMFMELSFGQYAALGPVAVYNKFCPLFRGLGYGMVIVSSIVMLYYNLIIAWTIYYMTVSFASIFYQLPWQNCDADWSTKHCYSYEEADACEAENGTYYLRLCYNQTYATLNNIVVLAEKALRRPPAEEYFTNQVLGLSSGIEETGQIRLGMAMCLLAAWIIVFLCLCKGVQSSGKVVYFTALFPYVVLVILFFRGVTLPGASTGILFYLTPDFSRLASAQVWGDAAVQIFFALSPAWGGLITLSSYNKFSNNCYIDSLIVAVSNIATSFFAGLVIFSVIGFLAHELNVEVDRVVDQGAGLAFIVYPEVVTRLPISPLWSILFFVMLLTLGLDSQFALMETVTTAILDRFPNFRQKKVWVVLSVAAMGYIGGLIFTTNSGMYWLQLMDKYAANWSVLIIAIGECILIAWIYGAENFCKDIQRMIGKQSKLWVFFWSAMWRVITPSALVFILVFNWIEYKPASYGHYVYPMWADGIGWALGVLPVLVVVVMAVDQICSGPDDLTIMEKARVLARPTEEWGASHAPCPMTSQDGGDSTSITSGVENETKRPGAGIIKSKKSSFKKKVQNFSLESDDGVIEPLLQKDKDKEKPENANQSAKFTLTKTKTESTSEKRDDKEKLLADNKGAPSITSVPGVTDSQPLTNGIKDTQTAKSYSSAAPIHNHMNTNVFATQDNTTVTTPKSIVLVEIDGSKQKGTNPLIFTTAKIHTDGKTKPLEPVQVTPVPILSTVEGDVVKTSTRSSFKDKSNSVSSIKNDNIKNNVSTTPITSISSNASSSSGIISFKPASSTAPAEVSLNTSNSVTTKTEVAFSKPSALPCVSVQNNVKITAPAATKTINTTQSSKNKVSSFASTPQTSVTTISETAKPAVTSKDVKSVASVSSTSFTKAGVVDKPASTTPNVSIVTGYREPQIDMSKNIQTTISNKLTYQAPETSASASNKTHDDVAHKDKISRTASSKSLKRQKKALVEDTKILEDTTTEVTATNNATKDEKDSKNQVSSSKAPVLIKQTVPEVSKTVKTVITSPKISANNTIVSNISTPSTKSTAISTTVTKSPQTSFTAKESIKSPTSTVKSTDTKPSSSSTASTALTQTNVSTVKPLASSTNSSSVKPTTTKTVTTTGAKVDKPSTTKPTTTSASTGAKSSITVSSKPTPTNSSQPAAKPSVVSTVKTITSDTSIPKSTANQISTSIPSKSSTVTTMKPSAPKAPSSNVNKQASAKSGSSSASAVKPNSKQTETKRSDSKDKSKA